MRLERIWRERAHIKVRMAIVGLMMHGDAMRPTRTGQREANRVWGRIILSQRSIITKNKKSQGLRPWL